MATVTPEEELRQVIPIKGNWFHSIEVEPGVWTNGHKSREQMAYELAAWGFPEDLTGKTVLDIGCADGGWSVAALRRGAESVLAIDEQMTTGMRLLTAVERFPKIRFRSINLFSNAFMQLPKFDFVIFTGVLYHVQDMLEALKRVRSRLNEDGEAVIETHVNESLGASPPLAVYYEGDDLEGDRTNWWGPNPACLEAMLRTAGFEFEITSVIWSEETHRSGRISYRLKARQGSVFGDITESATGSNSLLEGARQMIDTLREENRQLRMRLGPSS